MRKTIFLLSLITLLASCENELDNNYEINQDTHKVSQDSVLPSKDTVDSDTTPLERIPDPQYNFFDVGNCTYYTVVDPITNIESYPPEMYLCVDPETGEVYRINDLTGKREVLSIDDINKDIYQEYQLHKESELCECYYLQPDGPWQRHRCKKHNG